MKFQVDCVKTIPREYMPDAYLQPPIKKLKMQNGTELASISKCQIVLRNPQNLKKYSVEFTVVKKNLTPLLGKCVNEQMKLITVYYDNIANVSSVPEQKQRLTDYADVFKGQLGTLSGWMHLQADETFIPHTTALGCTLVSTIPR